MATSSLDLRCDTFSAVIVIVESGKSVRIFCARMCVEPLWFHHHVAFLPLQTPDVVNAFNFLKSVKEFE